MEGAPKEKRQRIDDQGVIVDDQERWQRRCRGLIAHGQDANVGKRK
jgi:hypothetical protein